MSDYSFNCESCQNTERVAVRDFTLQTGTWVHRTEIRTVKKQVRLMRTIKTPMGPPYHITKLRQDYDLRGFSICLRDPIHVSGVVLVGMMSTVSVRVPTGPVDVKTG